MAKKNAGGGGLGVLVVLVFSAVSAAYKWAQENIHIIAIVGFVIIVAILLKISRDRKKQAAWVAHLKDKYKSDDIVDAILNSEYWKGQTTEQLIDSLGNPHAVDKQVLKTKTKGTWKYNEQRKGQFALKVLIENGKVVGWDVKQ
jgi:hypothetical protein